MGLLVVISETCVYLRLVYVKRGAESRNNHIYLVEGEIMLAVTLAVSQRQMLPRRNFQAYTFLCQP
jgi:hypothetical protein